MDPVYLDYAATTPMHEEVRSAMAPYDRVRFGNPSSLHRWGREAAEGLEEARAEVAAALGARPSEIHFVRGGTESDNLAVVGACSALRPTGPPPALLVSAVDHPAVMEAAAWAHEEGLGALEVLSVAPDGSMDLDRVEEVVGTAPAVVSCMWVNNETGLVLPVAALAEIVARTPSVLHTDASQAVGKIPVDVRETPVDLLTATGHKIYGPRGTGVLYVRDGVRVTPLLRGGGQERALRPGTEDVAGAVGFARALTLAVAAREAEGHRMSALRERLEAALREALPDVRVNAGEGVRSPHVSNVGFGGLADGRLLLMALDLEGVAVSGGSACASGTEKGSHVISALYGEDDAYANVRFSFGRTTTEDDVDRAVRATVAVVGRMRSA